MQDKYKPQAKYHATHTFRFNVALNRKTDADIIAYLETIESKNAFFKALIRAQMAAEGIAAAKEERTAAPAEEDILPVWDN